MFVVCLLYRKVNSDIRLEKCTFFFEADFVEGARSVYAAKCGQLSLESMTAAQDSRFVAPGSIDFTAATEHRNISSINVRPLGSNAVQWSSLLFVETARLACVRMQDL